MKDFKIIPVIDILNSEVVHAVKGERASYKPIKSKLFESSDPVKIIKVLESKFKFDECYIADLDAIIKKNPNFTWLKEILDITGIDILLDPGISHFEDILIYAKYRIKKLILGFETIEDFNFIDEALKFLGQKRIIISFDMYKGKIISKNKDILVENPLKIIKNLEDIGIKEIILLDLFRVGQKLGGIPPLYLEILNLFTGNVLVGGGIRDYEDLLNYKKAGFSGVLIATALYDGTINIEKIRKICDL